VIALVVVDGMASTTHEPQRAVFPTIPETCPSGEDISLGRVGTQPRNLRFLDHLFEMTAIVFQ
jgi:hypothetical protein